MKVPLLKFRSIVIAPLQESLTDIDLLEFEHELLDFISEHSIRAVMLDVSVVDIIDSFTARVFSSLSASARLKGATLVIVGVQPEVAFTLAQLGVNLSTLNTALNLDDAMDKIFGKSMNDRGMYEN